MKRKHYSTHIATRVSFGT